MNKQEIMNELDGCEVWTSAFGERFDEVVCVLIRKDGITHDGKKFQPTAQEMKQVWKDHCDNEGITQEANELQAEVQR